MVLPVDDPIPESERNAGFITIAEPGSWKLGSYILNFFQTNIAPPATSTRARITSRG